MNHGRRAYPVVHCGIASDGRILITHGLGKVEAVTDGLSPEQLKARADKAEFVASTGGPWLPLPGNPPEHKIVGNLKSGKRVSAIMAGFVYNDACLLDEICGPGTYERIMPMEECEILQLARAIYGAAVAPRTQEAMEIVQ